MNQANVKEEAIGQATLLARIMQGMPAAFKDAVLLAVVGSVIGVLVNLVHPERIPFVAEKEYETLVPCPVFGGEVTAIKPDDPALKRPETFLVDARLKEEHQAWSFGKAMNVPYDYLDPTPEEVIQELAKRIASSRAQRVVVFGDGDKPDTGEQLGKEISGHGIKNVCFVEGGAPALKGASGGEP